MKLIERIEADVVAAMRDKKNERLSVLRMLKNNLKNQSIALRILPDELSDEQVVAAVRQETKKRKEAIEAFSKGGRLELAAKEQAELDILATYLPAALSDDTINSLIKEVIAEQNLTPPYQLGALMGLVMKKVAGRADGQAVRDRVQKFISAP